MESYLHVKYVVFLSLTFKAGEEVSADDFTYPVGGRKRERGAKKANRLLFFLNYLKKKRDTILPSMSGNQKLY
jgi:hypothetical protein